MNWYDTWITMLYTLFSNIFIAKEWARVVIGWWYPLSNACKLSGCWSWQNYDQPSYPPASPLNVRMKSQTLIWSQYLENLTWIEKLFGTLLWRIKFFRFFSLFHRGLVSFSLIEREALPWCKSFSIKLIYLLTGHGISVISSILSKPCQSMFVLENNLPSYKYYCYQQIF